jgi:hypothetical protein
MERESNLGAAAQFLIEHIVNNVKIKYKIVIRYLNPVNGALLSFRLCYKEVTYNCLLRTLYQ